MWYGRLTTTSSVKRSRPSIRKGGAHYSNHFARTKELARIVFVTKGFLRGGAIRRNNYIVAHYLCDYTYFGEAAQSAKQLYRDTLVMWLIDFITTISRHISYVFDFITTMSRHISYVIDRLYNNYIETHYSCDWSARYTLVMWLIGTRHSMWLIDCVSW